MRYYSLIPGQRQTGPWTLDELKSLYLEGSIGPNTPLESEESRERIRFQELWHRLQGGAENPAPFPEAEPILRPPGFARRAGEDLQSLTPHLLVPWAEFKSGNWLRHRRAFLIAAVGLMPLMIIAALGESGGRKRTLGPRPSNPQSLAMRASRHYTDGSACMSGYDAAPEANRSSRCAASRKSPLLTML